MKNDPVVTSKKDSAVVNSQEDGKSYETAIVIHKTTESAGIHAEYQWIRDHYAEYKVIMQSLSYHNKKPYDVITIQFSDERKQAIYFDISKFFK